MKEVEDGKFDEEMERLVTAEMDELVELYKKRKIEAKGDLEETAGDGGD